MQTLVITSGDPCGICPEIILKTLKEENPNQATRILIIGNLRTFQQMSRRLRRAATLKAVSSSIAYLASSPRWRSLKSVMLIYPRG